MKILFFSDIHGVSDNLEYLKNLDKQESFDKVVCLGDVFSYSFFSDKENNIILDFLKSFKDRLILIRGNCDYDLDIKNSSLVKMNIDDIDFGFTHGHLYNKDYNNVIDKGVLIYGHKHYPFIEKKDNVIYICVGSISLPRNNSNPCYAIYKDKSIIIYDIYGNIVDEIKLQ